MDPSALSNLVLNLSKTTSNEFLSRWLETLGPVGERARLAEEQAVPHDLVMESASDNSPREAQKTKSSVTGSSKKTTSHERESLRMECERLKTQVMEHQLQAIEARRRAEQADDRVDRLLTHNKALLDLVAKVEAANNDVKLGLGAKAEGRLCLHDKNRGYVLRQIDDDEVVIEFATSGGDNIEQVHHRDQFVNGVLPKEGDHIEAHVLAWICLPETTDVSTYLTPEELEHGFRGFKKAIAKSRTEGRSHTP